MRHSDKAAGDRAGGGGEIGVLAWQCLTQAARQRRVVTREELASALQHGTGAQADVDRAVFMVRMYCFLSGLPPLAEMVEPEGEDDAFDEVAYGRALVFDWQAEPLPTPRAMALALARLTDSGG